MTNLDAKIPEGPIAEKWTNHKNKINVVNPANKRAIDVIVVGTGLAGGSAAARCRSRRSRSARCSRRGPASAGPLAPGAPRAR